MSTKMVRINTEGERPKNDCLHKDGTPFPDPSGFTVNYGLPFDQCGEQILGPGGSIANEQHPPAVESTAPATPESIPLPLILQFTTAAELKRWGLSFVAEMESLNEGPDLSVQAMFAGRADQRKLHSAFAKWLRQFLRKAKRLLRYINELSEKLEKKISLSEIMNELASAKASELVHDSETEGLRRSYKQRTKIADDIERVMSKAEQFIPEFPEMLSRKYPDVSIYPALTAVRELAKKIKVSPSAKGKTPKPHHLYGSIAAFRLSELLSRFNLTQKDRDHIIRGLITYAFGHFVKENKWGIDRGLADKIESGRNKQKYPNLEVEGLLCRHSPKAKTLKELWSVNDWHFRPECSRWPKTDFDQVRFLNSNDPRICHECSSGPKANKGST